MTSLPPYSVVIPTSGRPRLLSGVLDSFARQEHLPEVVIVVDAGLGTAGADICRRTPPSLPLLHVAADVPSAARQRNQGAAMVNTPVVVFCDDDMVFGPEVISRLVSPLHDVRNPLAGVAARIEGCSHPRPSSPLRAYYRWQAGYDHPDFGGKLFGPAINCWPCYDAGDAELIPADWLNSALVAYRTEIFQSERFPSFDGYSYMEDVHLSARIARSHRLAFHRHALCLHLGVESTSSALPRAELVDMQWSNRIRIAREIMGTPWPLLRRQLEAHRAFVGLYLLRNRPPGWRKELAALARLRFHA